MGKPNSREKERLRKQSRKAHEEKKKPRSEEEAPISERLKILIWDFDHGQILEHNISSIRTLGEERLMEISKMPNPDVFRIEAQIIRDCIEQVKNYKKR